MGDDSKTPKGDDSKTPDIFSKPSQGESKAGINPEEDLFSGETKSHHGPLVGGNPDNVSAKSDSRRFSVPKKFGRYHHIEVVNEGGFGIVCRAEDSETGRVVALKFPRPEKIREPSDLKLIVDEANRAMELDHPGIVKTYSFEESDGLSAIVQEFIVGTDLNAEQNAMTNHQVIATLVAKIADALAYAHRRGIYHRDLKPANILIDQNGNPYIADFGLAMHEREQPFLPPQRCGTPHYMPPEQVQGMTRRLDGRSDIWSLGVILYELLTKRRPFLGRNERDIFDQIEHNDPRPPRYLPTHSEWLLWQWLLRSRARTKAEQVVWNAARTRFLRDAGLAVAALLVLGLSFGWWVANATERQRVSEVERAVENLTQQPFTAPGSALALIDQRHELAVPRLQAIYTAQPAGSLARIGAAYGLVPYDRRVQDDLIATVIAAETEPQQLERLVNRLAIPAESRAEIWATIYRNPNEDLRCRLRAFVAEVCQGPRSSDWATHAQAMAAAYGAESAESLPHWLRLLEPAREELLPHLQTLFADEHPAADPGALTLGIVELSKSKSAAAAYMVQHLPEWKTRQFQAAMNAVVAQGCREEFMTAATQRLSSETNPWAQASLSIALARLDHLAPLIELYSQPADQPAAIHAVNGSVPGRLEVKILGQIYRDQNLGTFGNVDLRRGVLTAFCLQAPALVDGTTVAWLEEVAHHHIVNDPDAGCFSSAELLFRRLGNDSTKTARSERRAKSDENGIFGNVMIDASGLAFSILPRAEGADERMAVCTTELTYQEMLDFLGHRQELANRYGPPKPPESKRRPAADAGLRWPYQHLRHRNDLVLVYEFCNWLSDNQGLEPTKWSYPAELAIDGLYNVMVDANAAGFRLPTHDEWQVANRSSDSLLDLVSPDGPVISNYAWSLENVRFSNGGVGNLLCNASGLFDMFGNMDEICHSIVPSNQGGAGFLLMGQTIRAEISRFNSTPYIPGSGPWNVNNLDINHTGFRIVRRLGPTN